MKINKPIAVASIAAGFALVAMMMYRRFGASTGTSVSERLQGCLEHMPENFPPRVMFENTKAARENTDEILQILRAGSIGVDTVTDAAATDTSTSLSAGDGVKRLTSTGRGAGHRH